MRMFLCLLLAASLPVFAAREFTNSTAGLKAAGWTGFTAFHSLSVWVQFRLPDFGSTSPIFVVWGGALSPNVGIWRRGSTREIRFMYEWAAGAINAEPTSGVLPTNTWHHLALVRGSTNSLVGYINGTPVITNTTTWNIGSELSAITNLCVGPALLSRQINGFAAEAACWTAALTQGEITALYSGANPMKVRPQSLLFYSPIVGSVLPEPDLIRGYLFTTNAGLPLATDHPKTYR